MEDIATEPPSSLAAPLQLSVIIVNYRTPAMTTDCLETLLPELEDIDSRIFVIDNDSGDSSVPDIQKWLHGRSARERAKVELIPSEHNGGFAAGNNIGLHRAPAQYYLLLNSDTRVRPGAIHRLLEAASKNPECGLLGPRLEFPNGEPQESFFRQHGAASELMRGAQLSLLSRVLNRYVVALTVDDHESTIEWTSFACVLIRGEVLTKIGLLDEGYFMYFEDAEFCRRAVNAGWKIMHDPRARVVHLRGGSSPVKDRLVRRKRLPRYYYESRARYFRQKGGIGYLFLVNCLWLSGRILCLLKRLVGRADRGAVRGEWLDLWIGSRTPLSPVSYSARTGANYE
ncbi:glycosyltransferase family 2 protein [Microbulbifer hainanensis]|uniref:glycosyltransferase family 2 protein n=1 Tax=Microbulbifer hainanensis TaxID=2735675 RepID=UPI001868E46C|nr:glycosyltransferase family 2 protein [Microbulbifer hainanensis]